MTSISRWRTLHPAAVDVEQFGAIVFVHAGNGIFVAENGYELVAKPATA